MKRLFVGMASGLIAYASVALGAPTLWVNDQYGNLATVDVASGDADSFGISAPFLTDIAFNPSGALFGIDAQSQLYSIDQTNGHATLIGQVGTRLNSLAFSPNGTLYGAGDSLYSINTATGQGTLIGTGGGYFSSGDLAFLGSTLYLSSTQPAADTLYRIDPSTGVGTAVGPLGFAQIGGLAVADGVLYGVGLSQSSQGGNDIYQINPATGAATVLRSFLNIGPAGGATAFMVPEPSDYLLLSAGLVVLAFVMRRHPRIATSA